MLQIKNTLGGGKPEGLYVWKKNEISSELGFAGNSVGTLPYNFSHGSAVVLNGEIHILGSSSSGNETKHYKYDGSGWIEVSTLPYSFNYGSAVVLNNEIHILGSIVDYSKHYKWDGSSWVSVSTLPRFFYQGSAVVFNNEIHILGSGYSQSLHYKWNGSSWTSVSTLPYNFVEGSAVVYNNEIHILGSAYSDTTKRYHYKWNGSSWTRVTGGLPYNFCAGSAVVFNNEIHILGGSADRSNYYKFDGSSWAKVGTLPYEFYYGSAIVFNNGIHILGSYNSNYQTAHYLVYGYVPVYTFLDYIVSDKETAYPDGGEKGGYWYERVSEGITPEMFGCTKMEIQEYIPTSTGYITGSSSHLWNHSLGVIPKIFMIIREKASDSSRMLNFYIGGRVEVTYSPALCSNGSVGYSYNSNYTYECHMSKTLVYLLPQTSSSSYEVQLEAGIKYRIIFMA